MLRNPTFQKILLFNQHKSSYKKRKVYNIRHVIYKSQFLSLNLVHSLFIPLLLKLAILRLNYLNICIILGKTLLTYNLLYIKSSLLYFFFFFNIACRLYKIDLFNFISYRVDLLLQGMMKIIIDISTRV